MPYKNKLNYVNGLNKDDIEIILSDLEFGWKKSDMEKAAKLWKAGYRIDYIFSQFSDRATEEVFLLLLHLAMKGKIHDREGKIWGK